MVRISDLEQDVTITGREVVVADDGEFGVTKQIVLTEESVTPAASIALLLANYIKEIGLTAVKFADGSIQTTASTTGYPVDSTIYLFGDMTTEGSLRIFLSNKVVFMGMLNNGNWEDAPLLNFNPPEE